MCALFPCLNWSKKVIKERKFTLEEVLEADSKRFAVAIFQHPKVFVKCYKRAAMGIPSHSYFHKVNALHRSS